MRKAKLSKWAMKYYLLSGLVILIIFTLLLGKTVKAPSLNSASPNPAANSYKIIPVSKTLNYDDKAIKGGSSVRVLGASTVLRLIHPGLANSTDPRLKKLAEYEQNAGGAVGTGMMIFTDIPSTQNDAQSTASRMAGRIIEFSKYNIKPIVIMEPSINGSPVSFTSYRNGYYDQALNTYFAALKSAGITDSQMGLWVYFPEANLPQWGPVDVADFAPNVVRTVNIQKKYFPASQSSIMLDAKSYPAGSTDWGGGSYTSFTPFIAGIPAGILDSFGLQGFPWAPPADRIGQAPSYNPAVYLNSSLAAEAANRLGVHSTWLNTGTFASMYTNNAAQTVRLSSVQRQTLLSGVLNQALSLKKSGYGVTVNSFNEDKSDTSQAIDRSYTSIGDQAVFNNFVGQLNLNGIDSWIFN